MGSIEIKVLEAGDWRAWRELRLEALAEAPYAFGSTLAEWQGAGDTEQRWRARLENVALNIIAALDGQPAGIIGATAPDVKGQVQLLSTWVAPWARGRGVGDALITAVLKWAEGRGAISVLLYVYEDNAKAIGLYRRNGFVDTGGRRANERRPPEAIMLHVVKVAPHSLKRP